MDKQNQNEHKKRILVVEDDKNTLKVLSEMLAEENFSVLSATDGEEGLAMALNEHPDMILLDIIMPKKDGLELLTELRQDPWGKNVPVVILTNLSNKQTVVRAEELSVDTCLIKTDCSMDKLMRKIKEKFEIKKQP